jgi:hypothetical protein
MKPNIYASIFSNQTSNSILIPPPQNTSLPCTYARTSFPQLNARLNDPLAYLIIHDRGVGGGDGKVEGGGGECCEGGC